MLKTNSTNQVPSPRTGFAGYLDPEQVIPGTHRVFGSKPYAIRSPFSGPYPVQSGPSPAGPDRVRVPKISAQPSFK